MGARVVGWAVAAAAGAVGTILTRRVLAKTEQLSSSSPGRARPSADEAAAPRVQQRGSGTPQQADGADAGAAGAAEGAGAAKRADERWRRRCEELERKLEQAAASSESASAAPRLAELSKLGRERQRRSGAARLADADGAPSSSSESLSSDDDGDPVPEEDDDEYIDGVGNVGEARAVYRKFMGYDKDDGGGSESEGEGEDEKPGAALATALEDKQASDAAREEVERLREMVASLRQVNATLNAKLDQHGEAMPREHSSTEFRATASAVRFLKPLHGEWALVAGSDSRLEVVADEYEPSAKEAACGETRYRSFRVVVSDTHTQEVQLNEYITEEAAYRVAGECFHALTTTHGFERGFQFHCDEDATRVYEAVAGARKCLGRQAAAERIPCLVKEWQAARGAVEQRRARGAEASDDADNRAPQEGRAEVRIYLPQPPAGAGAGAVAGAGATPAGARPGNAKFTREVEDHYYDYYSTMSNQQTMLEDNVRTTTYMEAIQQNRADFEGKVVVDVGAGSGILSFFAAKAGAAKVYAIEASSIAEVCRSLVAANGLSAVIEVVHGTVEAVELPEKADVLISEPMGFMLFHEQMLDSFVLARQKFLRPGGMVFPTKGTMYCAPVCDREMYAEQTQRANFWHRPDGLFGMDVSAMQAVAERSHFASAISDIVSAPMLPCGVGCAGRYTVDFTTATPEAFDNIRVAVSATPAEWRAELADETEPTSIAVHGLAAWFDVEFLGSTDQRTLSTAPDCPRTHWYQTILPLREPLLVEAGASLSATLTMTKNRRRSYDIEIGLCAESVDESGERATQSQRNVVFLQDMLCRYLWSGRAGGHA